MRNLRRSKREVKGGTWILPPETFERKEHQLFGEDGFEGMVAEIAEFEKSLGTYDLAQFTP